MRTILHGDCIEQMRSLPAHSVDAVFTSPPYAMQRASTYGGIPEAEYPQWTLAWMEQAHRLLRPDGSVIINIRPHIKDGQVRDYVLRTRLALRGWGWNEVDELVWFKPDGMPTGPARRPRRCWESLLWYSKHQRPYSDAKKAGSAPTYRTKMDRGRAHTYKWSHLRTGSSTTPEVARVPDVAIIAKGSMDPWDRKHAIHPAPFPPQLAEWVGRLVVPDGGTLLDPFCGVGSSGVAAVWNGWDYVGIDSDAGFADIARRRIAHFEQERR